MATSAQLSRYHVDGMDCASCAAKIDTAVRRISGVEDVSVSVTAGTMTVRHGDDGAIAPTIAKKVTGLGYRLTLVQAQSTGHTAPETDVVGGCGHGHDHDHDHDHHHDHDHRDHAHGHADAGHGHQHAHNDHKEIAGLHGHDHGPTTGPWWKSGKGRLTIASGVALAAAYAIGKLVPALDSWIFTAAMLVGLVPIARRAVMAALAGTPFSIEMLMTIAAVGAVIIGASEEAAAVVFLFLIGEKHESHSASKARASIP